MTEVWTMGELLVEIMRANEDEPLYREGIFKGPYPSGAPAIFIDTVARLGHTAGIIGAVGKDSFGKCLLERLRNDGVDTTQVLELSDGTTGCAFVSYSADGSREFIFHLGNTPAVRAKMPDESLLQGIKFFHIMGCSLFANVEFAKEILKTAKAAHKLGAKISFDPNIRKELLGEKQTGAIVNELLELTSVFLPGEDELLMLTGKETIKDAVKYCFTKPNLEIVALKQGAKGAIVFTKGQTISQGVFKVNALDATGAGDSFDAAFICGILEGKTLEEVAKIAAAAGALNTAAFGPMEGIISNETIKNMIKQEGLR